MTDSKNDDLQKCHNWWQTFGDESNENWDSKRNSLSHFAFVRCSDTNGKEYDSKENSNNRDHHHKVTTRVQGLVKLQEADCLHVHFHSKWTFVSLLPAGKRSNLAW